MASTKTIAMAALLAVAANLTQSAPLEQARIETADGITHVQRRAAACPHWLRFWCAKLAAMQLAALAPAEEADDLFEGDIQVGHTHHGIELIGAQYGRQVAAEVAKHLHITLPDRLRRGATAKMNLLWKGGVMVYKYRSGTPSSTIKKFADAMLHWEASTSLRFKFRTTETDYVEVYTPSKGGCSSALGRDGGRQTIQLDTRCSYGNAVHEIGHAFGFSHEQSRPDALTYVTIHPENIKDRKAHNFRQKLPTEVDSMGSTYDFGSIMHYGATAFTKNNQKTITAKKGNPSFGQRTALSASDISQAYKLYSPLEQCLKSCTGTVNHGKSYSCNQQLSCDQGCRMRFSQGYSKATCLQKCDRTGSSGCSLKVGVKTTFQMCYSCHAPPPTHSYVGCYSDDAHRDLQDGPKQYGYTAGTCAAACKNYKYSALQNGGWCVCGNKYASEAKYTKRSDTECNQGFVQGGGPWRNAVFKLTAWPKYGADDIPKQCAQGCNYDAQYATPAPVQSYYNARCSVHPISWYQKCKTGYVECGSTSSGCPWLQKKIKCCRV